MTSVLQPWVMELPFMQQSVLLTAVRGPDGEAKYGPTKYLLRWYRRCILLSSFEGRVINNPWHNDGGSFLGASLDIIYPRDGGAYKYSAINTPDATHFTWQAAMDYWVDAYLKSLDSLPHHFQMHFMHSAEIVGYKHPEDDIGEWWENVYRRLAHDMHLHPETMEEMDKRLGDSRDGWLARADKATTA